MKSLVLRLENGSGKSAQMANFTSALHLLAAWSKGPSQRRDARADIHRWLQQGRSLNRPVTLLHGDARLKVRYTFEPVRQQRSFEVPRSFALDGPSALNEPLTLRDEIHTHVQPGAGKTWASLSLLAQRLDQNPQQGDGAVLNAAKLNGSLALFRSVDGLWSRLQASVRLPDAAEAPPPSSPLPQPLAIACGVRRLTVPLIPRAPGPWLPGFGIVARDDCGMVAPAGGVRAA